MDLCNNQKSQNQKIRSKHYKKRLTDEQVKLLERSFTSNNRLQPERKLQLAFQLGIPPRQVAVWYQNKRARCRTQSLELDYSALQLRLEIALEEKQQLERDVERLKGELEKAQQMLFVPSPSNFQTSTSISCSYQEGMSSDSNRSSTTIIHHQDVNDEVLQLEDFYASLIGSDGIITWN